MSGIMDVKLRPLKVNDLEYLTLNQVLEFLESRGFCVEAMGNEEIRALAEDVLDGHLEELEDPEELDFSDG
jgi:hypothetical protein